MKVKELLENVVCGNAFAISSHRVGDVLVEGYVDVVYTKDIDKLMDYEVDTIWADETGKLEITIDYSVNFDELETIYQIKVLDIATTIIAPFEQYECISDVIYDINQWTKDGVFVLDEYGNVYDECGDKIND